MPFGLAGESYFQCMVNGTDMMVGANTLKDCSVIENVKSTSPSLSLTFLDNKFAAQGWSTFQDGAEVDVTMGDGTNNPNTYNFSQWSLSNGTSNSGGQLITLSGLANIAPWHSQVITKAYPGNSSDVLTQLAQMAGIPQTDITATQDTMTWLPNGKAIGQFCRHMVDRAWMGAGSCPHLAVTSQQGQWMLRLKDITQPASNQVQISSAGLSSDPSVITSWDHRISTHGGALNTYQGYGSKVLQEMQTGTPNLWQQVNIAPAVATLGISAALQAAVGVARTFYHPPDTGNAHTNYAQAYQNNRLVRASFSTVVSVLTTTLSTLGLMDDVNLQLALSDGTLDPTYSGMYKVTALTRHLNGGGYYEKIELTNQGNNSSASSSASAGGSPPPAPPGATPAAQANTGATSQPDTGASAGGDPSAGSTVG